MFLVLREFSLEHDLPSKTIPHNVVPLVVDYEQNVVVKSVGFDTFCVERKVEVEFDIKETHLFR